MSPSRAPQTYEGKEVTVTFDPIRCIHSEECVHRLPAVFDPSRKRWIRPDEASADEVEAAVARCPSGALRVRRRGDTVAPISPGGEMAITVSPDCGATGNPPFCDGSHARIGFHRP